MQRHYGQLNANAADPVLNSFLVCGLFPHGYGFSVGHPGNRDWN
jgi:hypothetical protein